MAEIVNLRRARKDRAKKAAEAKADDNRRAFGRTRAEKQETLALRALEARRLDGHRLEADKQDAGASGEPPSDRKK
ncbi:MAG: DUF4169 family protein [Rhodoblastus sp.]